jgi:peptidoglycan LD-endopeptidase CwlK
MYSFGTRSERNLEGVHPDLVQVARLALRYTSIDFIVTEGVRTVARQKTLVATGASKTMNSRHIPGKDGFAKAIDFAAWIDGTVSFAWPPYKVIAAAFKRAAAELGIPIVWGGDWKSFKDGPHIELDRKKYP